MYEWFAVDELEYCEDEDCHGHGFLCFECGIEEYRGFWDHQRTVPICVNCYHRIQEFNRMAVHNSEWLAHVRHREEVTFILASLLHGTAKTIPLGMEVKI